MGHADRFRYPGLRTTVEVACPVGHPRVLRCHPLRAVPTPGAPSSEGESRQEGPLPTTPDEGFVGTADALPFPTLFWLACDDLVRAISGLEHGGLITEIEAAISNQEAFRSRVREDHLRYIEERWASLEPHEIAYIKARGFDEKLKECGIGGIRNFEAVKCLHLHYGHHLARGSAIGALIEERLESDVCRGARERNPN